MLNTSRQPLGYKIAPLALMALVIVIDQISKSLIVLNVPQNTGLCQFFGDFLRIVHVRNNAVAFSMGHNLPDTVRRILFGVAPLVVLLLVLAVYFRNNDFTKLQRWLICGIVGGGFGNLIDRFFRPAGVVDFIDVRWFGLRSSPFAFLRWERWPTFNIADSVIVVCVIVLIISFARSVSDEKKADSGAEL